MFEVVTGNYWNIGRLEYWIWFFPMKCPEGRKHLIGKFYWREVD